MADKIELKVPDVGGEEVEVIEILVSAGDTIEKEDGVVTVESDKASMDIPASEGGKMGIERRRRGKWESAGRARVPEARPVFGSDRRLCSRRE